MKNVLALAAFVVIVFAAVGWYLGWYQVRSIPSQGGHQQVTIDLNAPKIGADLQKGESKLTELIQEGKPQAPAAKSPQDKQPHKSHRPQNGQPGSTPPWNGTDMPPVPPTQTQSYLPPAPGPQLPAYTPPAQTTTPPAPPKQRHSWIPFLPAAPQRQQTPPPATQVPTPNNGTVVLPGAPGGYEDQYNGGPIPPR